MDFEEYEVKRKRLCNKAIGIKNENWVVENTFFKWVIEDGNICKAGHQLIYNQVGLGNIVKEDDVRH